MGNGKTLAGIERGWIIELHKQNLSQRVIAIEIGRSKTEIENFLKYHNPYGTKKHAGWPKKISLALCKRIRREVKKSSSKSSNKLKAHIERRSMQLKRRLGGTLQ